MAFKFSKLSGVMRGFVFVTLLFVVGAVARSVYAEANTTAGLEDVPLIQLRGQIKNDQGENMPGTAITLFWLQDSGWETWPAQQYLNQRNPFTSDSFGQYQFLVPAGQYKSEVSSNGYYRGETSPITIETTPMKVDVVLKKAPTIWNFLVWVGAPVIVVAIGYFLYKRITLWKRKAELRQQALKKIKRKL